MLAMYVVLAAGYLKLLQRQRLGFGILCQSQQALSLIARAQRCSCSRRYELVTQTHWLASFVPSRRVKPHQEGNCSKHVWILLIPIQPASVQQTKGYAQTVRNFTPSQASVQTLTSQTAGCPDLRRPSEDIRSLSHGGHHRVQESISSRASYHSPARPQRLTSSG